MGAALWGKMGGKRGFGWDWDGKGRNWGEPREGKCWLRESETEKKKGTIPAAPGGGCASIIL